MMSAVSCEYHSCMYSSPGAGDDEKLELKTQPTSCTCSAAYVHHLDNENLEG